RPVVLGEYRRHQRELREHRQQCGDAEQHGRERLSELAAIAAQSGQSGVMTIAARMRRLPMRLMAAAFALVGSGAASAGELDYSLTGTFKVHVVSMREARFQTIILQKYDYSCGSAALASLLTYHYGRPTTEETVFKAMFDTGDQAKIQREGFSLLDMKVHLARQGLTADGFKITLDRLEKLGVPVIPLINTGGYRH